MSINPNRIDALDLIDKYFENGFKGAKFLQNYWNIDINDKKYIPYFEKIEKYNLPIIIHTGGEHAVSSNPLFEKIDVSNLAIDFRTKIVEDLAKNQKHIHDKLLFGTDYPVPFSIIFSYHRLSLKKRLELEQIKNPLDRYALFFLEFFDDTNPIFTNWEKLLGEKI